MRLTQVFMGPKNKILKLLVVADDSVMQVPGFIHPQNIIWLENLHFFLHQSGQLDQVVTCLKILSLSLLKKQVRWLYV